MPSAAMRSRLGVFCLVAPNGPMSAYPRSSMKRMTTFGLGGSAAPTEVNGTSGKYSNSAAKTCFIGIAHPLWLVTRRPRRRRNGRPRLHGLCDDATLASACCGQGQYIRWPRADQFLLADVRCSGNP